MKKYDSVNELQELVITILSAKTEIARQDKQAGWFDLAASRVRRMNSIHKAQLPESIEVSPLLASFLVRDDRRHLQRTKALDESTHSIKEYLKLIGYLNLFIFNPASAVSGTAKQIKALSEISDKYQELISLRDAIAGPILNEYLLTQEPDGKYLLKLADYTVFQFSVGQSVDRAPTGVDKSLDTSKLPPLPDSMPSELP